MKSMILFLHLWASRRIGYLLDQIRLNGENKELVDEITQLAREHGIVTPYTSYLIMEDEEIRIRRNVLVDDFQTLPPAPELRREVEGDYDAMKQKSGDQKRYCKRRSSGTEHCRQCCRKRNKAQVE